MYRTTVVTTVNSMLSSDCVDISVSASHPYVMCLGSNIHVYFNSCNYGTFFYNNRCLIQPFI